ncbi:MAG: cation transporter [Bacteroidales bacterium]|nr:cation transporter [Bacteroidales bacterium]MBN2699061.1 cation transporter [Bacteroidales bacterium]
MNNRNKILIRTSWIAIIGNAFLAVLKLFTGFISDSYAVIGDGIDSTTDIASSVVVLLAARMIIRPPNVKFPYGYLKADPIASKVLSFFIFFAGGQLAVSALKIIILKEPVEVPSPLAVYVTVISIIGKLLLSLILFRNGRRIESNMLTANAKNMRNDLFISITVLVGLIFMISFSFPAIDKWLAVLLGLFIMFEALKIFLKSNIELMDGIEDTQLYCQLFEAVNQVKGAFNPHRVRARKIGSHYMVNLDIEVEPELTVREAHEIARQVEKSIRSGLHNIYDVMVHVEPKGNFEKDEKFGVRESDVR